MDSYSVRYTAVDHLAGFLAASSLVLSGLAFFQSPALLASCAALIALIAARLSTRWDRVATFAIAASVVAFVLGMTLAVITENSLI